MAVKPLAERRVSQVYQARLQGAFAILVAWMSEKVWRTEINSVEDLDRQLSFFRTKLLLE